MKQAPLEVAQACIDRLLAARAQWLRLRRDAAAGGDGGEDRDGGSEEGSEGCGGGAGGGGRRKRWLVPLPPGGLALVACCVQLYPASDYRHAVLSPCALLVAEVLAQEGLPRGRVGLRRTLFLCSQALKLVTPSKRFMPELHTNNCIGKIVERDGNLRQMPAGHPSTICRVSPHCAVIEDLSCTASA